MLLAGILFRNVYSLSSLVMIDKNTEATLISTAFVLILIRIGMGMNPDVLQIFWVTFQDPL